MPKNKSFGCLENLKNLAKVMVKDDLIPMSDANSNMSGRRNH